MSNYTENAAAEISLTVVSVADGQRVIIRKALDHYGISFEEMSIQCGVPTFRLYNLVYKKLTKPLTEGQINAILLLMTDDQDQREKLAALRKFDSMSMPEILKLWADDFGIPETDHVMLGRLMGVSFMTIKRWSKDESRPNAINMLRLQTIVDFVSKKLKNAA